MRDQLRKLVDLAAEPHLTLQILPLAAGSGPGRSGPFTLLTLPEPAPDIVYGEGAVGGMVFVEDREAVRLCTLQFGMLTQLALPPAEPIDLIRQAAKGYELSARQGDRDMSTQHWRKSSFSTDGNGGTNCVKVTVLPDGKIGLRGSKHPEVAHSTFTRAEMTAWIKGVKAGEFDNLC